MKKALFRFYEELNDFLPAQKRKKEFEFRFIGKPSVKDVIESLGIPHTEVDLILVNGESKNFAYNLKEADRVSVYPVFESLDISSIQHLRPEPLRKPLFIADVHLGKLTSFMRMLGFDTLYDNKFSDSEIIRISISEHRVILTRDKKLLMNKKVTHGYYVRNSDSIWQITEVIKRFDLKDKIMEFSRCINCNSVLHKVEKENIIERLPPKVRKYQSDFLRCRNCGKIYWRGSHWRNMKKIISLIKNNS
ncbi:MAG: Mut7-C RNAse domain-containing protein [Ignavibacteriaceae bacterium]